VNNELKGYQFLLRRIFADYRRANQHEIIKGLSQTGQTGLALSNHATDEEREGKH